MQIKFLTTGPISFKPSPEMKNKCYPYRPPIAKYSNHEIPLPLLQSVSILGQPQYSTEVNIIEYGISPGALSLVMPLLVRFLKN
jgi:hypothetical protein